MGVENNPSISFGRNKKWSLNTEQKGTDRAAFTNQAPEGAKEKDKKKLEAQNNFNMKMFNYFDKNKDGILDTGELQDIQKAMTRLAKSSKVSGDNNTLDSQEMQTLLNLIQYDSKTNGKVDRNNLYEFLNTLNNNGDEVESAETSNGETTVVYKNGDIIKHQMIQQDDGTFKLGMSQLIQKDDSSGVVTTTSYDGQRLVDIQESKDGVTSTKNPHGKLTKIVDSNSGRTTTFDYESDPPTATEKQGQNTGVYLLGKDGLPDISRPLSISRYDAVTREYDVTSYDYSEDGKSVEVYKKGSITTYGFTPEGAIDEGHPNKTVTKNTDGNTVTTTFEYGEGDAVKRTKTVTDAGGNIISGPEEVDENGNPLDKTYSVKSGDTWYSIAQQQYGLTNHADIIEAVHILKDQYEATSGVAGHKKNIGPASVDGGNLKLPASITIGGKVVSLGGTSVAAAPAPAADPATDPVADPAADPAAMVVDEAITPEITVNATIPVLPVQPPVDAAESITPVEEIPLTVEIPAGNESITPAEAKCPYTLGDGEEITFALHDQILPVGDGSAIIVKDNTINYLSPDGTSGAMFEMDADGKTVLSIATFNGTYGEEMRADLYDANGDSTGSAINKDDANYKYDTNGKLTDYTQVKTFNGKPAEYVYGADGKLKEVLVEDTDANGNNVMRTYVPDSDHPGAFKLREEREVSEKQGEDILPDYRFPKDNDDRIGTFYA